MPPRVDLSTRGRPGLQEFAGRVYQEILPKLRSAAGKRLYREMADNDAIVGALLTIVRSYLQQSPWRVEPALENDDNAQQWADLLESCMTDMSHTWEAFIADVLSFIVFGWSWFEVCYKLRLGQNDDPTRNSFFNDGKVGIRELGIRDQETLDRWEFDPVYGNVLGMWQQPPPGGLGGGFAIGGAGLLYIPRGKSLHFRADARANNPEGRSLLRNSIISYARKKRIEDVELIAIERDMAGYPVLQVPPDLLSVGKADLTSPEAMTLKESYQMVTDIRRDTNEGAVVPAEMDPESGKPTGWKLSLISSGGNRQINIDGTIRRIEQRMTMTMLAQMILLGTENVGSKAMHGGMEDTFTTSLKCIQKAIESELNERLVPDLMDMNGCPVDMRPAFRHGEVEKVDLAAVGDFITKIAHAGINLTDDATERKLRAMAGLPDKPDDEDMLGTGDGAGAGASDVPDLGDKTIAQSTLAGPQVQTLLQVIGQVAEGQLPRPSGIQILVHAFALAPEQAEAMMGTVGQGFVPATNVAAAPAPSDTQGDGQEPADPPVGGQ